MFNVDLIAECESENENITQFNLIDTVEDVQSSPVIQT